MGQIKAIITDFDGTLVDTFEANYHAYKEAFELYGYHISKEEYKKCFGLRYDGLCEYFKIKEEHKPYIKNKKKEVYPKYFHLLNVNNYVLTVIHMGLMLNIRTCIASTASKENLYNVLKYLNIDKYFDLIITGEDVKKGKPNPDVYNIALKKLNCNPEEALVFEDSDVGCQAAQNAGINYIRITDIY